ncbi:MAG: hypothetical protein DWI22_11585 [Planctomycetota bacterium]|nr:MAG: hypothetical protein DWI22_11585 [Planctomycetota bacterium]
MVCRESQRRRYVGSRDGSGGSKKRIVGQGTEDNAGRRAINLGKQTLLVLTVTLVVGSHIKDSTAPFTQTRTRWKSGILGQRW